MQGVELSIVIVNYNVRHFLEQCLCSVYAALEGIEAEVWVVDNGSTDGSVDYLKPLFPEVRWVVNAGNEGFSRANNQAIRQCRGKYVLLLNPDTVIGEDLLRTLCFYMENSPKTGALGVRMIDGHGQFLVESKRAFPTPWVSLCKLSGLWRIFPRSKKFARYALPWLDPKREHVVEVLSGAFMFIRHEALRRAGLLDESFFMYGEDIDLSYRIARKGYQNRYLPERILHYKGESTRHNDTKYIRAFYGAMAIFFDKHYPHSGKGLRLLVRAGLQIKILHARVWGHKRKKKSDLPAPQVAILAGEASFPAVQEAAGRHFPPQAVFTYYNIEHMTAGATKGNVVGAFNRMSHFRRPINHFVLCYPDLRFEQILHIMDTLPHRTATFHIYNTGSQRIVSPGNHPPTV